MFKSYCKIAWRNLVKERMSSIINICGLAVGLAVTFLISLWIMDEFQYNKGFANYNRIAQVWQHQTENGHVGTFKGLPLPLGKELQTNYGDNFKYVVPSSWRQDLILSAGDKNLSAQGQYMDVAAPDLLSLEMIEGARDGLRDPHSILLSESTAKAFFGDAEPINRMMSIGHKLDVKVTGVYKDLPYSCDFRGMGFIAPWDLYMTSEGWLQRATTQWDNNSFQLFVQIADNTDFATVDKRIIDAKSKHDAPEDKKYNARIFLHPMRDWHLHSHWDNGVQTGGLIEYVRLFGIIGAFVLLLACINFMNLSTARSEKRAREVGIRKTVGSRRGQLISQFYMESLLIVMVAFGLSVLLVQSILPAFNDMASKRMDMPWTAPWFWLTGIGFILFTGVVAGSYPALYLSAFQPIKVLKGTLRNGRLAGLPRKVLVVLQFSISLVLIIGTIIVYSQIQYSKNRPIGYDRGGLVMVQMKSPEFYGKFDLMRTELKRTGAVTEFAESSSPLTEVWQTNDGFNWTGRPPSLEGDFVTTYVSHEFGKTVGWQFTQGRDFSRAYATDSSAVIINEAAVKYMGLKHPIGTVVQWGADANASRYTVVGVIKDMIMDSPYNPVQQTFYFMNYGNANFMIMKLNPLQSASASLARIQAVFKQYIPSAPFDYKFADLEFATKFAAEERIGKLATFFAALAIFISCLGLFGLASFVAEQRTKEIGVRKILGASVFGLWRLLSSGFVGLVSIALFIAIPLSYYLMHHWLQSYAYRTGIGWWVFVLSGTGAILLTLLTVTFQALRVATANPVKSLRSE
jgi:ABC-type antimicrobial peptide transport system permease subunit